jgi:hypothetical protein
MSFAMAFEEILDGPAMHGGTQMFNREDGKPSVEISYSLSDGRMTDTNPVCRSLLQED